MRLNTFAATVSIAALALTASACKSSSKASGGATPASNPPATQTQADSDNPNLSASPSASTSPSAATSAAAITSAANSPSASASAAASTAPAAAAGGEINACSLLTGAQASTLTGHDLDAGTASTLAPGQDACRYTGGGYDLMVTVYQPSSGVSWNMMQSVLSGVGTVMQVSGVGDKAMFAGIELDVATGKWLVAIQGADAKVGEDTAAIAVGKEVVGALASK